MGSKGFSSIPFWLKVESVEMKLRKLCADGTGGERRPLPPAASAGCTSNSSKSWPNRKLSAAIVGGNQFQCPTLNFWGAAQHSSTTQALQMPATASPTFPFDPVPNARNRWHTVRGTRVFGRWRHDEGKKVLCLPFP